MLVHAIGKCDGSTGHTIGEVIRCIAIRLRGIVCTATAIERCICNLFIIAKHVDEIGRIVVQIDIDGNAFRLHVIYVLCQIGIPCHITATIAIEALYLNLIHADGHVRERLVNIESRVVPSLIALVGSRAARADITLMAIGTVAGRCCNSPSCFTVFKSGINKSHCQINVLLVWCVVDNSLDVKRLCTINSSLQLRHGRAFVEIDCFQAAGVAVLRLNPVYPFLELLCLIVDLYSRGKGSIVLFCHKSPVDVCFILINKGTESGRIAILRETYVKAGTCIVAKCRIT